MKTPIAGLDDFAALDPFFRIIEQGLDGLAGPLLRPAELVKHDPPGRRIYQTVPAIEAQRPAWRAIATG
jgi:hypothetical protein